MGVDLKGVSEKIVANSQKFTTNILLILTFSLYL